MSIKVSYFTFFILLPINILVAQLDSSSIVTENTLDEIIDESDEESDNLGLTDIFEELIQNPIDINSADLIELTELPELDSHSAQLILDHRKKFGSFYSTNELYSIRELDKGLIQSILPFIKVSGTSENVYLYNEQDFSPDNFLTKTRIDLRSRITNDLQNRDGFISGKYVGSKLKSYNRLLVKYQNKYQLGILTEKDPGESSYTDFNSFHLQVKDLYLVKNFIAGDYVLEYGQGLALWSPFGFSKGTDAIYPVKKRARYLRPYTSSTEYRFFRGTAAQIQISDFNFTAFYSNNSFDATIDSLTGNITSVGQTGYHRFESELNKKKSAKSIVAGGVVDYRFFGKYNIGAIFYNASFNKNFESESIYSLTGNHFSYLSTYYDFNFTRINFFGEFSYDGTSVASINGFIFSPTQNFIFTTSIRNYPRNYNNIYGFGFSENSGKINNEVGIYSGLKWRLPFAVLNLYYDIFKYPFSTSENFLPSEGN